MTHTAPRPHSENRDKVGAPLYHQVYSVLRQQLLEGQYASGCRLPSEHELEELFAVSRITVRRALDRLASEGLVIKRHGKGTFAQPAITPPSIQTNLRGMLENLVAMGRKTSVEVIEFGYTSPGPDIATRLALEDGEEVQRAIRVRRHEGQPFSHLTTWVPASVGRQYTREDISETPLLSLFEKAGIVITEAEQRMSAKLADTQTARLLGVELGTALLSIRRLVRDDSGRPIELLEALYRPDLYEYTMHMTRRGKQAKFVWSDDMRFLR
ncbi:MAG: GntR family transcriptional regulator [Pseudorhodobacter sp.]